MINKANFATPVNVQGKMGFKAGSHPITDEALKLAESKEVKNIIRTVVRKGAPWNEIDEKISELTVAMLTPKDKTALRQFMNNAQGEWQVNKEDGTHDVVAGYIKSKLRG